MGRMNDELQEILTDIESLINNFTNANYIEGLKLVIDIAQTALTAALEDAELDK